MKRGKRPSHFMQVKKGDPKTCLLCQSRDEWLGDRSCLKHLFEFKGDEIRTHICKDWVPSTFVRSILSGRPQEIQIPQGKQARIVPA